MNSLYTLGVRQTNSIQADLERLRGGETSAALLGQHSSPYPGERYLFDTARQGRSPHLFRP
jgi:hypothetical protein